MKKKISKINLKKDTRIKFFLICLFISFILWLLVNLSKVYRTKITILSLYQNPPAGQLLFNEKKDTLHAEILATGMQILQYNFRTKEIKVDLDKVLLMQGKAYFWLPNRSLDILRKELGVKEVFRIKEDSIALIIDKELKKKVPIISKIKVFTRQGFKVAEKKLSYDSVEINGPANLIKKIIHVYTEPLKLKELSKNIDGSVSLIYPSKIKGPTHVNYKIFIEKYTEKKLNIKINPINLPLHTKIQMIPNELQLKFTVGYSSYDKINAQDFQVVCNFEKISDTTTMLPLEIVKFPEKVENIRLYPTKVKVILIKDK